MGGGAVLSLCVGRVPDVEDGAVVVSVTTWLTGLLTGLLAADVEDETASVVPA